MILLFGGQASATDFADTNDARPAYVTALEKAFGAPNQEGFGSTVLSSRAKDRTQLNALALAAYRYFLGENWERRGEARWMAAWHLLHERKGAPDIVAELRGLSDATARSSADLLLEGNDDPAGAKAALEVFNDPTITDMLIYSTGDGEAMSGLLLAARRQDDDAVFVVMLMD